MAKGKSEMVRGLVEPGVGGPEEVRPGVAGLGVVGPGVAGPAGAAGAAPSGPAVLEAATGESDVAASLRRKLEALPPPYEQRDQLVAERKAMVSAWEAAQRRHQAELSALERRIAKVAAEESKIEDRRLELQRQIDAERARHKTMHDPEPRPTPRRRP